jgi:N-acetylmuramoyl-L-alanine amidase
MLSTTIDTEFELLCQIVFVEANLESDLGQQLVVHTVLNRVEDKRYPNTVEGVIFQKSQFCGVNNPNFGRYTEDNARNVRIALDERNDDAVCSVTRSALFFHNNNVDTDAYAKRFNLEYLFTEGNHKFLTRGK